MKNEFVITSVKHYHETMVAVYNLMNKGEKSLKKEEMNKLRKMTEAAEKYEDKVLGLRPPFAPQTLPEMIELKMFEKKLTQTKLAKMLGIANSKLSQILSGKRGPDVAFLKMAHEKLGIDAAFLLTHA